MSYSVSEAIEDSKKRTAFLEAVKEHFPDVYLSDERWYSATLRPEDCDDLDIDTKGVVRAMKRVGGGAVYASVQFCVPMLVLLMKLREKPALLAEVITLMRGQ